MSERFAFPHLPLAVKEPGQPSINMRDGMTLRDWFAGQALQVLFVDQPKTEETKKRVVANKQSAALTAEFAYLIADAMLAESDKKK